MSVLTAIQQAASTVFSWFRSDSYIKSQDKTKRSRRAPNVIDWTDDYQANYELTNGLYHNIYPGFKLAGGLAYAPIAVPVWFMGIPIPVLEDEDDEDTADFLQEIIRIFSRKFSAIHTESHRDGTIWVYPFFSSKTNSLEWEFIPDYSVSDIIRSLDTGEIIRLITDEQITLSIGYNQTATVRRIRTYTKSVIKTEWAQLTGLSEEIIEQLDDVEAVNVAGIIPIAFSNNRDSQYVRGHSDYERIVTDLKDYHDIDLAASNTLAKFNVKMIQYTDNVDEWLTNNAYSSISEVDIQKTDLIINLKDKEATEFAFPERANEAYDSTLKRKFRKIVESSMIPELAWGVKVTGNLGSFEVQMDALVKYVEEKRAQHNNSYQELFGASLRLLQMSRLVKNQTQIKKIEWNKLDAISEESKSTIFSNYMQGLSFIMDKAGMTKQQLYNFWRQNYPVSTQEDFEKFQKGIADMGAHKQWTNAAFDEGIGGMGLTEPND